MVFVWLGAALLSRFPASRHYVVTFSRFRRVKVVARPILCLPDEWLHHPTSLYDETTTTADLEVSDLDRLMTTLPGHTMTVDMGTIGSLTGVTIAGHDTAVMCARPGTAFSGMLITLSHLTSSGNFANPVQIIDGLFSPQISMDNQSGHRHHVPTMKAGV